MAGAGNPAQVQPNAFEQAAQSLQLAGQGTIASGMGPDIQAFQNPYQQAVIDRTQQDIERQRQMAMNTLGAQTSAANAFGGSRHGVAESLTNEAFARQAADTLAQQRMEGFNTALGAAQSQQDIGLRAANQLASLGNLGFGQAMDITSQQAAQGLALQALNQQLINAAMQQYAGFTGAPEGAIQLPIQAASAGDMGQGSTTATYSPGLIDYLSLIATTLGSSDRRLKTNIRPLGTRNGIKLYSWDWNEDGKRIADPTQPTVGVMADELMGTHPHLVRCAPDGYLRVDYGGLTAELGAT